MVQISLCLIVKNEEESLDRCLKSAWELVDEIIIADTGSQDATREIAESFGARVFDFPWEEDFSAARNFCMAQAGGDWVLWLDADEELTEVQAEAVRSALLETPADMLPLRMLHVCGSEKERYHYRSSGIRLLRRAAGIRFQGKVHEALDTAISPSDLSAAPKPVSAMRIVHYGYTDEALEKKQGRNLSMLWEQKKRDPQNAWTDYHLGAELMRLGESQKAFSLVNRAIEGFLEKGLLPPALLYGLKYKLLTNASSFESAYPGIERAISLYPDYTDLHFYKGMILFALKRYREALAAFSHCVRLGENLPHYLIMQGCGSHLAVYGAGQCLERLKNPGAAKEAYRQALALSPQWEAPARALAALEEG